MSQRKKKKGGDRDILVELCFGFFKAHAVLVISAVVMGAVAYMIQSIVVPRMLSNIFTSLKESEKLYRGVLLFMAAFAAEKLCYMVSVYLNRQIKPLLAKFMFERFAAAVMNRYLAEHQPVDVAMVMTRIVDMTELFENILRYLFMDMIPLVLALVATLASLFAVHVKLGLLSTAAIVAVLFVLYLARKTGSNVPAEDLVTLAMEDTFHGLEFVVSAPCGLRQAKESFGSTVAALQRTAGRNARRRTGKQMAGYAVAIAGYTVCALYLVHLFLAKEVDVKAFEANIMVLGRLFEFGLNLAWYLPDIAFLMATVVDQAPIIRELFAHGARPAGRAVVPPDGSIVFDHVRFQHRGPAGRQILGDFNLAIASGELVCLYGPSGSGKSTTVNLLQGILRPDAGHVLLGGVDVCEMSTESVYRYLSIVNQNSATLMRGTVYSNLVYGLCGDGDRAAIEAFVAELDFADRMFGTHAWLDLPVTKGGLSLSGGQRQIVHLLRAALNPESKVVVLDEPTSALDGQSRDMVLGLVARLRAACKTVVIITHDDWVRDICPVVVAFSGQADPVLQRGAAAAAPPHSKEE